MKLSVLSTTWATFCLLAVSGIVLAVLITGWQNNAVENWNYIASEMQDNILQAIHDSLDFLKFASSSPPFIEPLLANLNMPNCCYNPFQLARMFDVYDSESGFTFASFGMLIAAQGRVANLTNPNGKLSWQIAKGFGCSDYIYAYSDASINPKFLGHCVDSNGIVSWNDSAYIGGDWGLKPEEASILAGNMSYTFLPIFNLLGRFTLTHEIGYPTNVIGEKYAVIFAEISLQTFSDFISNNVSILGGKGYAYIAETQTSAMIASTYNTPQGVVVDSQGNRLSALTSNYSFISDTFQKTGPLVGNWRINTTRYQDQGLDWTITVVVKDSDIYGNMNYRIMVAALICMAVIIIFSALNIIGMMYLLSRSIQRLVKKIQNRTSGVTNEEGKSLISDLDPVDDVLENLPKIRVESLN